MEDPSTGGDPLIPFPCPRDEVPPLTAVRSTLLSSSLKILHARGLEAAYRAALPQQVLAQIVDAPVGTWLPAPLAEAHYAACTQLALPEAQVLEIGRESAKLTGSVFMSLGMKLAQSAGATPWLLLENAERYWQRYYVGSAIGVFKTGPKDARIEAVSCSLSRSAYWRIGLRGVFTELGERCARMVTVRERWLSSRPDTVVYRLSWV